MLCLHQNSYFYSKVFELQEIARASSYDANLYIFITGSKSKTGGSGLSYQGIDHGKPTMGSVCDSTRDHKIPIVRFVEDLNKKSEIGEDDSVCQNGCVCTGQVRCS